MAKKAPAEHSRRLESLESRITELERAIRLIFWSPLFANPPWRLSPAPPSPPFLWGVKDRFRAKEEIPIEPWRFLVAREHPWRKQLYVKGRNMTARQLVGAILANKLDEEKASINYKLPVEAIREALAYVEQNRELLETESEIERLMLKRGGVAHGPRPVS
jgi:hypothetical protein